MTTPNARNIIRVPGSLCHTPTNLSLPFPHGGTALGIMKMPIIRPFKTYHKITAEEFGSEVVDIIDGGESWVLGAILRTFDKDAISKLFAVTGAGSQTQETYIQHPDTSGTIRAGTLMSTKGIKLLFSPEDTERHPFALFYNAIPLIEETAEMNFEISVDWSIAVLFAAIRDSNGKSVAIGFKGDISLT